MLVERISIGVLTAEELLQFLEEFRYNYWEKKHTRSFRTLKRKKKRAQLSTVQFC